MKSQLIMIVLLGILLIPTVAGAGATDISGTWTFTVVKAMSPGTVKEDFMKYQLLIVLLLGLALETVGAGAANISGTWACSIEMGESKPTNVTFAFKQEGETLRGTYTNPKGAEYQVTGTVKGDQVAFSYELSSAKQSMTVRYTGAIASPTRMTGSVEWIGGGVPPGKWTATKKK